MKKVLLLIALMTGCLTLRAQVFINEVCASNADIKYDPEYFNFSPWVELYNAGNSTVNLSGYYLSDKLNEQAKWQIPAGTSIVAKGYLLIWCDDMSSGLHTNFSLDSDGEDVVLSSPALLMIDKVTFPEQPTNISYGRTTDGGSTLANLTSPSPSAQNNSSGKGSDEMERPQFSLSAGRYTGVQSISIAHPRQGATIRFTVDGSEPTAGSSLYSTNTPVQITATATLKAKAFMDDFIPSETEVASYFVGEHAFSLPVVSISTKPSYLWDNTIGIYTNGTNGITGNCQNTPMNWNQDWDRHAVIEYFTPDGQRTFDQAIDIRIGGACSRGMAQKSLVIKARDKYGSKTIDQKLFETKESDKYGGFMLRNSGNDFNTTQFRDALMQHLPLGQMDIDYMAYQPAAFYLNGQYWGIQNLREKIDADYMESNFGIAKDDVDLLEIGGNALEGTSEAYNSYLDSLQNINSSLLASFSFIDRHIDVQEFINYLVAEIYYCNTDWPGNNMKFWRQRSTNGKFRWILWDTDFGFGLYSSMSYPTHPTLNFVTDPASGVDWPNPPWSTLHIRLLLQNPVFRTRFIQTMTTAMSTTFNPVRVNQVIDQFQNRIKDEMLFHKQRWGGSMGDWNSSVQQLKDFSTARNVFMQQHVADFFQLNEKVSINIKSTPANLSAFDFNGVVVDNVVVDASYYKGIPVTVETKPHDGYIFKSWKITKRESTAIPLIARGDSWKYFDQGTFPASWNTAAYNDNTWTQGSAQLGYGDGDEATAVSFGGNGDNKFITTYFRKSFSISDLTGLEDATGSVLFDDGAIIYLNGTEIYRGNMPAGTVGVSTLALEAVADENAYNSFTIPKSLLQQGVNVIAVEIHQNSVQSSDISFDLDLHTVRLGNEIQTTSTTPVYSDTTDSDITLEASFDQVSPVSGIVINEFGAAGSSVKDEFNEGDDWIELFNSGPSVVDLAGLYITDNLSNKTKFRIPEGSAETIVQPGQYKLLWADEDMGQGPLHLNFKLSADGESIGLYQVIGVNTISIDEFSYDEQPDDVSSARIPNGTGPFLETTEMTPGSENILATGVEDEFSQLVVYPNPTTGLIKVKSAELMTSISVYDIYGRLAKGMDVNSAVHEFSLDSRQSGLYIIEIRSEKKVRRVKVVKE